MTIHPSALYFLIVLHAAVNVIGGWRLEFDKWWFVPMFVSTTTLGFLSREWRTR